MAVRPQLTVAPSQDRLDSWKEIAAYLSRNARTVRRWEQTEGLPVHRLIHDKRGSVFAYRSELDAWWTSRKLSVEPEAAVIEPEGPLEEPVNRSPVRRSRWWIAAGAAVLLAAGIGGVWLWNVRHAAGRAYVPKPEAARAIAKATFPSNPGRVQIETSIGYLEEAIRIDPGYAAAWARLAAAHVAYAGVASHTPKETLQKAKIEAQKALELQPSSSAWMVLANVSHQLDWNHALSEQQYRKALELTPKSSVANLWFAEALLDMRRFDEAFAHNKQSSEAGPGWLEPVWQHGNIEYLMGHPDLAILEYERALASEPSYGFANHFLGRAYLAKGESDKAIVQFRKSTVLLGNGPAWVADLGYALAVGGKRDEAQKMAAEMLRKRDLGYYPAIPLAQIELGLGHTEPAVDWLERAAEERCLGWYMPSVDPIFDPIRGHPRFRKLMAQMKLDH